MREFNTTGPCDPALHYTVMREALIAEGLKHVRYGKFFTIFAPRQSGKTTYFRLLAEELGKGNHLPILISFENLKTVDRKNFYEAFSHRFNRELAKNNIKPKRKMGSQLDMERVFEEIGPSVRVVLVIDEFEGIPDVILGEIMHTFRYLYHQKEENALHSLILVGVSSIAELVVSDASPFNVAEELQIPYFSFDEVSELIGQYVSESDRKFHKDVIKAVHDDTKGQPGLVCALCRHLVEKAVPDKSLPVAMDDYYKTRKFFLTEKFDKNIINIVQKAREKRAFMLKLLFREEPVPFSVHEPDIAWLRANGVVDKDNGDTDVTVPLYKKALITAFRPLTNGETDHYIDSPLDWTGKFLYADGGLNINALIVEYRAYVRKRGFRAFDTDHLREAAWHYSLDGYISFFIGSLGGETFVEVPSGRGRTDILIRYNGKSHIVEIKVFTDYTRFAKGKEQLAEYLLSERLEQGYYVVFSNVHTEKEELCSEETVKGKTIFTHVIPVKFGRPSGL